MITTRGFGVDVMPQFTPANPSLVAFNPSQAVSGALDSMKLASALQQIKAVREAQQELDVTRASRLKNTIASNEFGAGKATQGMRLLGPQTDLDLEKIGSAGRLLPEQEAAVLSKLRFDSSMNDARLDQVPALALGEGDHARGMTLSLQEALKTSGARTSQTQTAADQAALNLDIAGKTANAHVSEANDRAASIRIKLDDLRNTHELEVQSIRQDLIGKIQNAASDREKKSAAMEAEVRLKDATANWHNAQASLMSAGGNKADMTERDILTLENSIIKAQGAKSYLDTDNLTPMTLKEYEGRAYNEDGTRKNKWSWGPMSSDELYPINPRAEQDRAALEDNIIRRAILQKIGLENMIKRHKESGLEDEVSRIKSELSGAKKKLETPPSLGGNKATDKPVAKPGWEWNEDGTALRKKK